MNLLVIACLKMSKIASRKALCAYKEASAMGIDFASFLSGRLADSAKCQAMSFYSFPDEHSGNV